MGWARRLAVLAAAGTIASAQAQALGALHPEPPRLRFLPSIADFYPPASLARGEQGLTRLYCRLLVDGTLEQCRVAQSSGFAELDAAAFNIARLARYTPMIEHGAPREIEVILPVRWVIADD